MTEQSTMKPVEVFHPAEYICDELSARGWTTDDLVLTHAAGTHLDLLALNIFLSIHKQNMLMGSLAEILARGFGTSEQMWRNLDQLWRAHPERLSEFSPPESVFGPISCAMIEDPTK